MAGRRSAAASVDAHPRRAKGDTCAYRLSWLAASHVSQKPPHNSLDWCATQRPRAHYIRYIVASEVLKLPRRHDHWRDGACLDTPPDRDVQRLNLKANRLCCRPASLTIIPALNCGFSTYTGRLRSLPIWRAYVLAALALTKLVEQDPAAPATEDDEDSPIGMCYLLREGVHQKQMMYLMGFSFAQAIIDSRQPRLS